MPEWVRKASGCYSSKCARWHIYRRRKGLWFVFDAQKMDFEEKGTLTSAKEVARLIEEG
jgi:hypothetical protein